jgi:hypothetical protein
MKSTGKEFDADIQGFLNHLRQVSPLDSQMVAAEREKFLAQGEIYRQSRSQQPERRRSSRKDHLLSLQMWSQTGIWSASLVLILLIAMLFAGMSTTVYAAQSSLPDELLYPVKTWSEDFRLSLSGSPQSELAFLLDFTDRRMAEIDDLNTSRKPIPGVLFSRYESQLDTALQIAAWMAEPQMGQALMQIRQRAEMQLIKMAAWIGDGFGQGFSELAHLQTRLQEQRRLAAAGLVDPQGFRMQVQQRLGIRQNVPSQTPNQPGSPSHTPYPTPVPTGNNNGTGPGGGSTSGMPGGFSSGGINPSQTPAPTGGSYGPGQPSLTPGGYDPGPYTRTATSTPAQTGTGSTPTRQFQQTGGPGSGNPNPTSTIQPGGPGSGTGQPTTTSHRGNNP